MEKAESEPTFSRLRMDLVAQDVEFDDANRTMRTVLVPDPRRYEHREIEGTGGWYDLFDHTFIPDDVFADMARQMPGTPMYYQPQDISDAGEYVQSRRGAIDLAWMATLRNRPSKTSPRPFSSLLRGTSSIS